MYSDSSWPARAVASAGTFAAQRLARGRDAVRRPGTDRDTLLLLGKAALATVLAWQFAVRVLDSPSPFYAPMAALLVVDRTMVRSLWASAQRVAAVVVGMSVAWLVGTVVGVHWWSMLVVIYLALLVARWRRLGDHGIQVPTMVLLSLLTVGGTDTAFTYLTIVETVAGGVIGVVTNAVVLAPLHVQTPREKIVALTEEVRELLRDLAEGVRTTWDTESATRWYDTSTRIIEQAPAVRSEIEQGLESTRFNPRDRMRPIVVDWAGYARTVETVRRAQWHVSAIARTLLDAADDGQDQPSPSPGFLERYAGALDDVATALEHFGLVDDAAKERVGESLARARGGLEDLRDTVRTTRLDDPHAWPAYGALLLDATRLIRELETHGEGAVVPTDSGPIRRPSWQRRTPPGG